MQTKKGDFVELEFTGKIKETGAVFDTTNPEIAKKNDIFNKKMVHLFKKQNMLLKLIV